MLKLFDRYVLKEIVPPFALGLLVYTFVLLMNQILILSEYFIDRGVPLKTVLSLLFYLIPSVLAFTVPMAVLMGILAGLSRMSSDTEITAFKTLGISNRRLLRPVLVFSLCGWLIASFLLLYSAPRANYRFVRTFVGSVLTRIQFTITPREFNETIPRSVLYIQDVAPDNTWENIFVHLAEEGRPPAVIFASRARMNVFGQEKRAVLELFDGTVHTYHSQTPEEYQVTTFEHREVELDVAGFFASVSDVKSVREKDIGELVRDAAVLKQELVAQSPGRPEGGSFDWRRRNLSAHWIEIHKKFSLPFACFIFAFLGIALGATTRKGGRTSGFTVSIAVIIVYYILITGGENLAREGHLAPWLGMWGPNLFLALLGMYFYISSHREWDLRSAVQRKGRGDVATTPKAAGRKPVFRLPRVPLRFPSILDRYIIRKYLAIFVLSFLSMLAVFVIITFFERIDSVYEHHKPLSMFLDYLWFKTPEFMHYVLPVSALVAALVSLGLLSKFNEITAMKACGISLYRVVLPVVVLAVITSGASFYLQENILPATNRKADDVWNAIVDAPPRTTSQVDRRWIMGKSRDRIFHYQRFDTIASAFHGLTLLDIDPETWTLKRRTFAEKGFIEGRSLSLSNCWSLDFTEGQPRNFQRLETLSLDLDEERAYFLSEWKNPSQMSFGELRRYIQRIEERGFETSEFKVNLQFKMSFPLVSLIMVLIGIPFAFSMGKRGTLVGIALSMGIVVVYWVAVSVFRGLGNADLLSPVLAAWGPNIIFGLLGIYLMLTLRT